MTASILMILRNSGKQSAAYTGFYKWADRFDHRCIRNIS